MKCHVHTTPADSCRACEDFEERAAIYQYDAGMSREDAERKAMEDQQWTT